MDTPKVHALVLLIANDVATTTAVIDGVIVPGGAGSKEFSRIPSAWLLQVAGQNVSSKTQSAGKITS